MGVLDRESPSLYADEHQLCPDGSGARGGGDFAGGVEGEESDGVCIVQMEEEETGEDEDEGAGGSGGGGGFRVAAV